MFQQILLKSSTQKCSAAIAQPQHHGMAEVNDAYKHGRYENTWPNSLLIMSNMKVFATQECWLADQPNTTDHIDPYDTHMYQKDNTIFNFVCQSFPLSFTQKNTHRHTNSLTERQTSKHTYRHTDTNAHTDLSVLSCATAMW